MRSQATGTIGKSTIAAMRTAYIRTSMPSSTTTATTTSTTSTSITQRRAMTMSCRQFTTTLRRFSTPKDTDSTTTESKEPFAGFTAADASTTASSTSAATATSTATATAAAAAADTTATTNVPKQTANPSEFKRMLPDDIEVHNAHAPSLRNFLVLGVLGAFIYSVYSFSASIVNRDDFDDPRVLKLQDELDAQYRDRLELRNSLIEKLEDNPESNEQYQNVKAILDNNAAK
jgi:hypothetical protein